MREHLDRILEGLPCGVLVVKSGGTISRVNPEARRLVGWNSTGNGASGFESLSSLDTEFREFLEKSCGEDGEQEQAFPDADGGERWVAVRHAAVPDPAAGFASGEGALGEDAVSIFILREVSDAKRLAQEKDKLRREQALAEMSAVLAHEIRNPLGSLELFAGLLAGAELSPAGREWVEQVQTGLRTLAATVNNVLHFHSLPAPQCVPTDLGALLDWAGGFLVPLARQARVELCLRNHLHGVWFSADRHRLEQVLLNLVLNALRAMPGGGWIEISGQTTYRGCGADATISVTDTGPGVVAGSGTRIFEPGFSTRPGSPGLGLAVCRKIVEQHGGALDSVNRAGVGARFTMTFPLAEDDEDGTREVAK